MDTFQTDPPGQKMKRDTSYLAFNHDFHSMQENVYIAKRTPLSQRKIVTEAKQALERAKEQGVRLRKSMIFNLSPYIDDEHKIRNTL